VGPHAGGKRGHREGVGGGVALLLVGVGGALEFVELFDLGRDLQLLHRAAEEHRLERDARRLEACAWLEPDLVRRRDRAIGRRAGCEETLAVGYDELVLGAQAQESSAQLLRAGGAKVHFGRADEDALDIRVIRRGIEPEQGFDKGRAGESGAEGVGGRLVGRAFAQVDLQNGIAHPLGFARRHEGHDQDKRNEDEEHHQGGQTAKEGEQESSHTVISAPEVARRSKP